MTRDEAAGCNEKELFFIRPSRQALESVMVVKMFRPILLPVVLMLGACQPIEQAPPARRASTPSAVGIEPSVASKGKSEQDMESMRVLHLQEAPAGALVPHASIEKVEPGQEALAEAILNVSKEPLDHCRANSGGGTLHVKVVNTKTSTKILLESDSKIGDDVRNCVIGALSTIDISDTLSNAAPSMRPSAGFTSTFAISW